MRTEAPPPLFDAPADDEPWSSAPPPAAGSLPGDALLERFGFPAETFPRRIRASYLATFVVLARAKREGGG